MHAKLRPVLESHDGHLTISSAKDRNITLKILGSGYVNVNEINLLHVASAVMNICLCMYSVTIEVQLVNA